MQKILPILRYIIPTLWINFRFLPFRQAVKLPIIIYKPHFLQMRGKITIDSPEIRPGMIKLGFLSSATYPNSGIQIKFEKGGEIIFKGKCRIGNDSYILCGKKGCIEFGDDFRCNAGLKLISQCGIKFGEHASLGWGCVVMDTNFHPLFDMDSKTFKKAFGRITIGDNNWFGIGCMIMHSVSTPKRCIFGARTIVTRGGQYESYCVHGGSPVRVLTRNVKRIIGQDMIKDYSQYS